MLFVCKKTIMTVCQSLTHVYDSTTTHAGASVLCLVCKKRNAHTCTVVLSRKHVKTDTEENKLLNKVVKGIKVLRVWNHMRVSN